MNFVFFERSQQLQQNQKKQKVKISIKAVFRHFSKPHEQSSYTTI